MPKGRIVAPDQAYLLECGKCHKQPPHFTVIIAGDGVTCRCVSCHTMYKLESPGGVVIANG